MKAYLVTYHEYDSHGVVAVFLNEAAADDYVSRRGDDLQVEEWDVVDGDTFSGNVWNGHWQIGGPKNYYPYREYSHISEEWLDGEDPGPARVRRVHPSRPDGGWFVDVVGTSREAVEELLRSEAERIKAEMRTPA